MIINRNYICEKYGKELDEEIHKLCISEIKKKFKIHTTCSKEYNLLYNIFFVNYTRTGKLQVEENDEIIKEEEKEQVLGQEACLVCQRNGEKNPYNTMMQQIQIRSSDEAANNYCVCLTCGERRQIFD